MTPARRLWNHPWTFWVLLGLPAVPLLIQALGGASAGRLLHTTGELSVRLLILALAITPLRLLFRTHRWPSWLMARRRAIGVASFGYAALHLVFYGLHEGLLTDLMEPGIAAGWLAFLVFVPLALTSNDAAVRWLKERWKLLQRGVYVAALLTAAHWILLEYEWVPALVHFAPLAALQLYRVTRS